jgi:hypothetical protein
MYIHVYNVYTSVYHYHTMYIYSLLSTGRFYNSGTFRGSASCLHVDGIKLHDSFGSGGVTRLATQYHAVDDFFDTTAMQCNYSRVTVYSTLNSQAL